MERIIGCAFAAVLIAGVAFADQFNDANYFEENGVPVAAPSGGVGGNGSGAVGGFGANDGGASQGGQSPSAENNSADASDTGDTGEGADAALSGSGIETEEELIDLLTAQGAVTAVGNSITDEASGASGGGFVTVDGAKMRAAAKNDPDIGKVLSYWRGLKKTKDGSDRRGGRLTTGEYYSLVAAELASGDEQLERATLEASRFKITYRSRGALFAVIPMSFPVRIEVTGAAAAGDRVLVRLPWYRWFVRKYFSANSLAGEVDAVVAKKLAGLGPDATDVQAILFTTVADFLKQKVRTISDTILLGASG